MTHKLKNRKFIMLRIILQCFRQCGEVLVSKMLLVFGPILSFFKWEPQIIKNYQKTVKTCHQFLQTMSKEHWNNFNESSKPKDMVDLWLLNKKICGLESPNFEKDENCNATMLCSPIPIKRF